MSQYEKRISDLPSTSTVDDEDLLELSVRVPFVGHISNRISCEDFRNTLGTPPHDIDEHTDTIATGTELNTLTNGSNADTLHIHNVASHNIAEHSDTSATGPQLNTLTNGSNADTLHIHNVASHNIADHADTIATGTELNTLTNGSNADTLHSHSVLPSHNIADHADTTATGTELNTLVSGSSTTLHTHEYADLSNLPSAIYIAGENISQYQPVYMHSDGKLRLASASSESTTLAVFLSKETKTTDQLCELYFPGEKIINASWSWTPGTIIYLGTTSGTLTHSKPSSSGNQIFVIGIALSSNTIIFTPGLCYIEVA